MKIGRVAGWEWRAERHAIASQETQRPVGLLEYYSRQTKIQLQVLSISYTRYHGWAQVSSDHWYQKRTIGNHIDHLGPYRCGCFRDGFLGLSSGFLKSR